MGVGGWGWGYGFRTDICTVPYIYIPGFFGYTFLGLGKGQNQISFGTIPLP
jgi:hypothetical protein